VDDLFREVGAMRVSAADGFAFSVGELGKRNGFSQSAPSVGK
jgi:hypothetical protein